MNKSHKIKVPIVKVYNRVLSDEEALRLTRETPNYLKVFPDRTKIDGHKYPVTEVCPYCVN